MKRLSSLPLMRRFFAVVLFVIGTVTASAQVYYMNVYQKDGSRSRFVVDNLDSVNFTFEQAPVEGLEYVDLGLSVKWATFNVGATSPYETGDFFSFGETEPKDSYTRSNYKYYEPDNLVKYTKYNFYTRYGIVDYKYRLDMEDDVARVKWGGDWRMPTIEEMEELVYNCYWEWTEINSSVYGYKVTGPNGNSIFLPAGYYRDDEDESTTPLTSYLSSTLSNEYPGHAIGIDFYDFDYYGSDYYDISPEGRYFGELIRPVYSFDTPDNVKELSYFNLKEQSLTLKVGERYALSFEMDSSFMFVPDIICKGDDCVQVNSNGLIDAFAPGTTTITVNLGNYSYECVVTVVEPMIVAEEVDLGLSVKWATCNLGAETPESYGYYYSWGETTPKTSYYQNSYKWYDNSLGYIKYSSYAENADDKWILDDEDDAARAYWGDNWRIPTNEEMEELIRNCSWEWIEGDGVAGYKVTSLVEGYTDNYIFLPNAGLRYYSNLYYNYDCGYYWTTSRKGEDRGCYLFSQLENNIYLGAGYRFYGRSIRPVRSFDASDIDSIVIDVERLQLNIDQNYTLSVHGISSSGRIIAVGGIEWESDNVNVATVDEKGVVTPVAEGSCTIKAVSNKTTVYCSVVVINPYQPQYVDLGLSVMWASFNIGARSPEEKGNYYAWGETEVKDYYDESTYKWYDSETESLTKYNLYAERGDVDLKYRLDPEDDVAHVVWGEEWRLPTNEEFQELIDSCDWRWEYYNGTYGYRIFSRKNENFIFMPCTGYKEYDYVYDSESYLAYMSNSLDINIKTYHDVLCLEDDYLRNYYRFSGYTVRPVYSSSFINNVISVTGMSLEETAVTIETGQSIILHAHSEGDTLINASWTSDYISIAKVSSSGVVVGITPGECHIIASVGGYSQSCTVTVTEAETVSEYVDLGLSVKWATCNVGASRPEYFGNYYAWGETELKSNYIWDSFVRMDSTGSITKYNLDDGKTVLDPEDDIAYLLWGEGWRMPTGKEFQELHDNCKWVSTIINGVDGYEITGPNGNSIFLPRSGYCANDNFYSSGTYHYTSSTSLDNSNLTAYYSYSTGTSTVYRYYGFPIRPVSQYSVDELTSITLNRQKVLMFEGDILKLELKTNYLDGLNWLSTDESVATVREGVVTALNKGTCNIVVSVGELKDTCVVTVGTPEYVNLGLSVNWATFNLGAHSPEDYGDYYAWGETETKDEYSWYSYKWADGSSNSLTKYCSSSDYGYDGFVDDKTDLDPEDDVASVRWGGEWRMPSEDEFNELINKCTWIWTTENGVLGYRITSNVAGYTDNSIFLPASGYNNGSYVQRTGSCGDYWSRNTYSSSSVELYFYNGYITTGSWNRCIGLPIRPVCENKEYVNEGKLYFDSDSLYLAVGSVLYLAAVDEDGVWRNNYCTWTSSNDSVVSVDSEGEIHALSAGYAEITASYNGLTAVCYITVVDVPDNDIDVSYEVSEDGLHFIIRASQDEASFEYVADFAVVTDTLSADSIVTSEICVSSSAKIIFDSAEIARYLYNELLSKLDSEVIERRQVMVDECVISLIFPEIIGKTKDEAASFIKEMYINLKEDKGINLE